MCSVWGLREGSGGGKQEFFSEVRVCSGMENDLAVLKFEVCSRQKRSGVKKGRHLDRCRQINACVC